MAKKVSKRDPSIPSADQLAGVEGRQELARRSAGDAGTRIQGRRHPDELTGGFSDYGISGLQRFGSVSRVYEEFLKELQGPAGMKNYREMLDNDPIVGAIMFAVNHLCRKVSVKFKPANNSQEARKVADFVGSCIFDDLESTWPDTLSEILTMLPFGWALMEFRMKRRMGMGTPRLVNSGGPVYGSSNIGPGGGIGTPVPAFAPSRFDDGLIGFRSWSLRSQETLFMWEFDEDSTATHMQQMAAPDYRIRRIPLAKSFLFRTQVSKNNPEGRSVLRNAWTSYYMKKNLQIFEGIGIERDLAGYPVIKIEKPDLDKGLAVPDIWNTKDTEMVQLLSALQKIVRSVRQDEQMGMVLPWWANFELVSGGSRRRVDTNSIITRYDQRISQSMMFDFIMLGHEAVGSKALAATKISLVAAALSSFLDVIGAIFDRRATPMLLQFNAIPLELAPTFEHGDVESINIQELGDFIANVAATGFNPLEGLDAQIAAMNAAKLPTTGVTGRLTLPVGGTGTGAPATPARSTVGDAVGNTSGRDKNPVNPQESNTGTPDTLSET